MGRSVSHVGTYWTGGGVRPGHRRSPQQLELGRHERLVRTCETWPTGQPPTPDRASTHVCSSGCRASRPAMTCSGSRDASGSRAWSCRWRSASCGNYHGARAHVHAKWCVLRARNQRDRLERTPAQPTAHLHHLATRRPGRHRLRGRRPARPTSRRPYKTTRPILLLNGMCELRRHFGELGIGARYCA